MPRAQKKNKKTLPQTKKPSRPLPTGFHSPETQSAVPNQAGASTSVSIIAVRAVVILAAVFIGVKLVGAFHFTRHGGNSGAPAAITSNEMSKPVTERRMTDVFDFSGVKTKWGYSGWTKDGSANPSKNKGIYTDDKLSVNGVEYGTGLGTQAPSEIVFDLKGKLKSFSCKVGVDRGGNDYSSVVFEVWGDKKKLFQSPVMKVNSAALPVQLNVGGIQELSLKVDPVNPSGDWDQADWVDIQFE